MPSKLRSLERLIRPRSICLFGSAWAANVVRQLKKADYSGEIYAVHPHRSEIAGIKCVVSIADLPQSPDASFVGLNRQATVEVISQLAHINAGGAVCFASGFQESGLTDGGDLQKSLVDAAGDMPIFGPNCYGFLNYLDNVPLWPDEHGGIPLDSGVAIIAQSSNIALNMTMQKRGLRLAYLFTLGNQAQTQVCDLIDAMVADERVSGIGLYLEGFGDLPRFYASCLAAREAGKSIVAIKTGKTAKAQLATQTHTASLAGDSAAASALLKRLGIIEVDTISVFIETLKLLDHFGSLPGPNLTSVSSSGGEASLMSDLAHNTRIEYPDFPESTVSKLNGLLGNKVTIANPLDYHTYVWGDVPTMTEVFSAILETPYDLHLFVLDVPREDRCAAESHDSAVLAICQSAMSLKQLGLERNVAVVSLLPENLSESLIATFSQTGVFVLNGAETAIAAIDAVLSANKTATIDMRLPLIAPSTDLNQATKVLDEYVGKQLLAEYGVKTPRNWRIRSIDDLDAVLARNAGPWVMKALGLAHKSEHNAVRLSLHAREDLLQNFSELQTLSQNSELPTDFVLLEEQFANPLAELIIGVSRDQTGLMLLTVGMGGVYTELLADVQHLLIPTSTEAIKDALSNLKMSALLKGYRGAPEADIKAVVDAVLAVADYVSANIDEVVSLDINPLMVGAHGATAVDVLIEMIDQ